MPISLITPAWLSRSFHFDCCFELEVASVILSEVFSVGFCEAGVYYTPKRIYDSILL